MGVLIKNIIEKLDFEVLAGINGINHEVHVEMLSRPGVELGGFLDFFDKDRLVLIGSKENSFLMRQSLETQRKRIDNILKLKPPGIIFSVNVEPNEIFIELGNKYNVPILKSNKRTTPLNSELYSYLHSQLAPRTSMHGVLLDIHGMGTMITGKSGIGKSETALELIKRGHQLISDDRVDIYEVSPGVLIGNAPKILERYLEIRGIGIVDVVNMFGAGAYRADKKIRLIVELEHWNEDKVYDRLGVGDERIKIFNSEVSKITIPVLPGRNVATLVESAAMNQKLKVMGFNAAETLIEAVGRKARKEKE